MTTITPANLWLVHRAAAGGKSTITGAPLPQTIDDCAEGPQATHYAMAVAIAVARGEDAEDVPVPSKVTPDRAAELRANAARMGRSVAGLARTFEDLAQTAEREKFAGSA